MSIWDFSQIDIGSTDKKKKNKTCAVIDPLHDVEGLWCSQLTFPFESHFQAHINVIFNPRHYHTDKNSRNPTH